MIRKLSDFKGEQAVKVWADLLVPVGVILKNADVSAKRENDYAFIAALMKDNSKEVLEMLQVLSDDPDYAENVNGITIMTDVVELIKDEDMRSFFGLRGTSSRQSTSTSTKETH